ncbi:Two-component signal transduction system YycFG, regulatory protein YycI [Terribacillus halophilus]|uniref:Two-component signal transduction system YycFG, regulatory protein YycI n=1 Tax=Terribacillus halophilus TaxID=361279 RepID=A0A1G6LWF1_9BACI|nr:two-component system regulatory protein YycI [Terribacillus halophilus]SDC47065.1 Two-component signal transduction system YycFG, regulatory protein YycI [Terribacillus halophilus]
MQWNKIKLMFILAFLVLNIYLIFQLFPQEETEQLVLETESQDKVLSSVTGYKELSDEETETNQQYEAKKLHFTDEDLEKIPQDEELDFDVSSGDQLVATFKEPKELPIEISADDDQEQITEELSEFAEDYVLNGKDYTYWGRQGNKLLFFQKTSEGQTYFSPDSLLLVTLNSDYKVTEYTQTYIEDFKKSENQENLKHYSEKQAVKALQSKQLIEINDKIEVEKGFYPTIELSSKLNFAPAYKITVNGTKHYFYMLLPDYPYTNAPTESVFLSSLEPETEETQ